MFIGKESVMKPETICLACEHVILNQTNQKLCKKLANYKRLYMSVWDSNTVHVLCINSQMLYTAVKSVCDTGWKVRAFSFLQSRYTMIKRNVSQLDILSDVVNRKKCTTEYQSH